MSSSFIKDKSQKFIILQATIQHSHVRFIRPLENTTTVYTVFAMYERYCHARCLPL